MTSARPSDEVLEILREVSTLDCFYTGASCPPNCECLSARAGRAMLPTATETSARTSNERAHALARQILLGLDPRYPDRWYDYIVSVLAQSSDSCNACERTKPRLDPVTGRFECFFCAPVKLPKRRSKWTRTADGGKTGGESA